MLNKVKGLSVLLVLLVLGLIVYVQRPTSKAYVAAENFSSVLKNHAGATLMVHRSNSSSGAGKVAFVGEDYIQTSSGTYYPISAIVSASAAGTILTIEVR